MTNRSLIIRRVVPLALGLSLHATGLSAAEELPEGTFASDIKSCAVLETKTPAELGEELNFQILSKKGLIAHQQTCDFVTVTPHKAGMWLATAICDELGYNYPDLFSIKQKDEGRLNVTRLTDLTQEGGEAPAEGSDEDKQPSDGAEVTPDITGPDPGVGEPPAEEPPPESYSTFVKCPNVK
jgi:hypothetical protein